MPISGQVHRNTGSCIYRYRYESAYGTTTMVGELFRETGTKTSIPMKAQMLSIKTILAGLIIYLIAAPGAIAQDRAHDDIRVSPNAVVSQTIGTTEVTITYGRPAVRDRDIFGELVPFDEIWRTGADEATTITLSDDVKVEGEPLEAGTYSLFTIPQEEGPWTVIFNQVADQWGAYNYNPDEDALRVRVEPEETFHMEQIMFYFEDIAEDSGKLMLHWDDVKFGFRIDES